MMISGIITVGLSRSIPPMYTFFLVGFLTGTTGITAGIFTLGGIRLAFFLIHEEFVSILGVVVPIVFVDMLIFVLVVPDKAASLLSVFISMFPWFVFMLLTYSLTHSTLH